MDVTAGHASTTRPEPGVLVRVIEGVDGTVEIVSQFAPRPDYACTLPQFDICGHMATFDHVVVTGPANWQIETTDHALSSQLTIRAGERVTFTLGVRDASACTADPLAALDATIAFWRCWAALHLRGPYRNTVVRSALALKLLTDAPSGAIVAAPTTSLPETIGGVRNWDYRYTWIRDAPFTLYALLLAGYLDEDDPFFAWTERTVELEHADLQVLHPISPEGDLTERVLDHLSGYRGSQRCGSATRRLARCSLISMVRCSTRSASPGRSATTTREPSGIIFSRSSTGWPRTGISLSMGSWRCAAGCGTLCMGE
jgi:hypothetical protein